ERVMQEFPPLNLGVVPTVLVFAILPSALFVGLRPYSRYDRVEAVHDGVSFADVSCGGEAGELLVLTDRLVWRPRRSSEQVIAERDIAEVELADVSLMKLTRMRLTLRGGTSTSFTITAPAASVAEALSSAERD
ncbi:MAG TPA: hypothetical protein VMK16_02270, partial [Acidimicrobiales bacterium]|nr:hypothetical protein [Acidimicrobiales bacterium]